jgi:hypothetical protein
MPDLFFPAWDGFKASPSESLSPEYLGLQKKHYAWLLRFY